MFKKLYKRITGIEARELLEAAQAEAKAAAERLEAEAIKFKEHLDAVEKAEAERIAEEVRSKAAEESARLAARTPKELATESGEPWVNVNSVVIDQAHPGQGAFELDWNEFFIAKLVRAGYVGRDDEQIVDQWFGDVCRNVVLETYQQYEANNPQGMSVNKRDLGDGRVEIS